MLKGGPVRDRGSLDQRGLTEILFTEGVKKEKKGGREFSGRCPGLGISLSVGWNSLAGTTS